MCACTPHSNKQVPPEDPNICTQVCYTDAGIDIDADNDANNIGPTYPLPFGTTCTGKPEQPQQQLSEKESLLVVLITMLIVFW